MQSLNDLVAQLGSDDLWADERTVVDAVASETQARPPSSLADVNGEWKEPFVELTFNHDDGTVVNVIYGDEYTAIVGGGVHYRGYLEPSSAIDVLIGALRGRTTYVDHERFGYTVADYFEVVGREGQRLGYSRRGLTVLPFLLRSIPGLPETIRRMRLNFDGTPAIAHN